VVDLAAGQVIRTFALGLIPDDFQNFGFWSGEFHVVADTEQHGSWSATFFDHERTPLVVHTSQELPEISAGATSGDYDRAILFRSWCGHELSVSIV